MGNGLIDRRFFKYLNLIVIFILTVFQVFTKIKPLFKIELYIFLPFAFYGLAYMSARNWIITLKKYFTVFISFSLIMYMLDSVHEFFSYKQYLAEMFLYGLWPVVFIYSIENFSKKQLKKFSIIILLFLNLSSILTAGTLAVNPDAARILAGHKDDLLVQAGVGGYGYIYCLVFLSYGLIIATKNTKKTSLRWFFVITLGISYYTILFSSYSTAILTSLLLLVFAWFNDEKNMSVKNFSLFIIVIVIYIFRIEILTFIRNIGIALGLGWVDIRMGQLINAMTSGDYESLRRVGLYEKSFNIFIANFFTGEGRLATVGGHSTGLDLLAKYGIWGILFLIMNYYACRNVDTFCERNAHIYYILIYLVFTNINTCMSMEIPCSAFFLSPLMVFAFKEDEPKVEISEKSGSV